MAREADDVAASLANLCKQMGITCLIDVGAEDGYEAGRIRDATGCSITLIDADPRCNAPEQTLIGATDHRTTFYLHSASGLSSALRAEGTPVEMEQKRLDTFCAERGLAPDALLIDTEGTTLDVLEGCGQLLDGVRLIYAECQTEVLYPGVRLVGEVDAFLGVRGFTQHLGPPAYCCGGQGNFAWWKP